MYTQILEQTATQFDIALSDLVGPRRAQHLTPARQAAAYTLRCNTALSLVEIGKLLGRKDHTTVMYAIAAAERRAITDIDYALRLAALRPGATS